MTSTTFARPQPLRHPDTDNRRAMTTRGWVLTFANFFFPGAAQLLAGNRFLARVGLFFSTILWLLVITAAVLFFTNRDMLLSFGAAAVSSALWMQVIQVAAIVYAVVWTVLTVDTIRLIRFVRTGPFARWLMALFALAGLGASYFVAFQVSNVSGAQKELIDDIFVGETVHEQVEGRYNIMLLGGDAGDDRWGLRPDSLSVVSIDMATGDISMIGVPRNMQNAPFSEGSPMLKPYPNGYNCGDTCLVNALYTYGMGHKDLYPNLPASTNPGIEATRDALEGITGLEIQYYVLIDMAGFEELIDAMGGVTVDVEERVPMATAMDKNGNFTNLKGWIEPGKQVLDGYHALWYARSRVGSTDYVRMERQRQLQEAIVAQFDPVELIPRYQEIAKASSKTVSTDLPASLVSTLTDAALGGSGLGKIKTLELVPPEIVTYNPDFDKIHAMVQKLLSPPPVEKPAGEGSETDAG